MSRPVDASAMLSDRKLKELADQKAKVVEPVEIYDST
jgi:hypothetical protein